MSSGMSSLCTVLWDMSNEGVVLQRTVTRRMYRLESSDCMQVSFIVSYLSGHKCNIYLVHRRDRYRWDGAPSMSLFATRWPAGHREAKRSSVYIDEILAIRQYKVTESGLCLLSNGVYIGVTIARLSRSQQLPCPIVDPEDHSMRLKLKSVRMITQIPLGSEIAGRTSEEF